MKWKRYFFNEKRLQYVINTKGMHMKYKNYLKLLFFVINYKSKIA